MEGEITSFVRDDGLPSKSLVDFVVDVIQLADKEMGFRGTMVSFMSLVVFCLRSH